YQASVELEKRTLPAGVVPQIFRLDDESRYDRRIYAHFELLSRTDTVLRLFERAGLILFARDYDARAGALAARLELLVLREDARQELLMAAALQRVHEMRKH